MHQLKAMTILASPFAVGYCVYLFFKHFAKQKQLEDEDV